MAKKYPEWDELTPEQQARYRDGLDRLPRGLNVRETYELDKLLREALNG